MTTCCFDGVTVASDTSCIFKDTQIGFGSKKIAKGLDFVIFFAGHLDFGMKVTDHLKDKEVGLQSGNSEIHINGFEKEKLKGNKDFSTHVFLVTIYGHVYFLNEKNDFFLIRNFRESIWFEAVGTGSAYAMAAMCCGKKAEKAVKVAKILDPYTGGKVDSIRIADVAMEYYYRKADEIISRSNEKLGYSDALRLV